jgi:hypothetical protein
VFVENRQVEGETRSIFLGDKSYTVNLRDGATVGDLFESVKDRVRARPRPRRLACSMLLNTCIGPHRAKEQTSHSNDTSVDDRRRKYEEEG